MKVNDILSQAKETLYYRNADYNRALALTEFIKALEKEYKSNFKVLNGSIKKLQCRDIQTKTEKPSFTTYATFIVNGTKYYIQINDNPFFESYICIYSNHTNERYKSVRVFAYENLTSGEDTLKVMFEYNGFENITLLKNDLLESFKELKEDNYTTCTKLNDTERIYF